MTPELIARIILAILILVLIGIYLVYIPKTKDKEEAQGFIASFKRTFQNIIETVISDIDITKYDNIQEFESDVFAIVYGKSWTFIQEEITKAIDNDTLRFLVAKCLTRDNVEKFVSEIVRTQYIGKVEAKYVQKVEDMNEKLEMEDQELQYKADLYELDADEIKVPYEEPEEVDHSAELNPPREEGEEPYDPNDVSQEIVES